MGGIAAHVNQGSATYNIITKAISGTNFTPSILSFERESAIDLASGETIDFRGWYMHGSGNWPAVDLTLHHNGGITETNFIKLQEVQSQQLARRATCQPHITTEYFTLPRTSILTAAIILCTILLP
ncbi:MAG: hypothetical protein WCY79_06725 [Bacteroidales bacterium]